MSQVRGCQQYYNIFSGRYQIIIIDSDTKPERIFFAHFLMLRVRQQSCFFALDMKNHLKILHIITVSTLTNPLRSIDQDCITLIRKSDTWGKWCQVKECLSNNNQVFVYRVNIRLFRYVIILLQKG